LGSQHLLTALEGLATVSVFPFAPARIERDGSSFRLFFRGIPGRTYTVQAASGLQPPVWQNLGTAPADGQGAFQFLDPPPPGITERFYRAIFLDPAR